MAPLPSRALLSLMLAVPAFGCAAKPPGRPIVLRQHHPERRPVHRPAPALEEQALSSNEKEKPFRDVEAYLSRSGKAP